MFLPLRTDSPLRTTPYLNWLLILANVLVFVVETFEPHLQDRLGLHPRSPQLYQFLTYQFTHAGLAHLAGNMLFLFIFGNNVNDKMGHLGYLAFYLAGGVVAGIAFVISEHTAVLTVGASGSIAAVTGAYLVLFPRSHITLFYWFFFIGRIELQALLVIGFFFAQDVFLNLGHQDGVAHMAHIGGTVFGTLMCLALLVTQLLPRDQFDVWALIQRWNKRRQYRDLVAKGYNPFDYAGQPDRNGRRAAPVVDGRLADLRDQIVTAIAEHRLDAAADLYLQLKSIDPAQVLSRQAQLDVATQLNHDGRYAAAAEAYESLLRTYPKIDRVDQIELLLGLLYSRYLKQYDRAQAHLRAVAGRVHGGRELELANAELAVVDAQLALAAPGRVG
jgi:membrane associated rhomboid family serine protease